MIACDQTKDIVHLANDLDVFVMEKPPRCDSVSKDPNGDFILLNTASNGLYTSLIAPLKKVHFIPLPSLQNLSDGSMKNLFTDGIHLKNWGIKLLSGEIIRGVQSVYTEIKPETKDSSRGMEGQIRRGDSSSRVVGLMQALRKQETKDLLNYEESILETLGMMSKPNTFIDWMKVPIRM